MFPARGRHTPPPYNKIEWYMPLCTHKKEGTCTEMKFHVDLRETLVTGRIIEADSVQEAKEKAKQMYEKQEIILNSEDFTGDVDIRVFDEDYNPLEGWDENYIR